MTENKLYVWSGIALFGDHTGFGGGLILARNEEEALGTVLRDFTVKYPFHVYKIDIKPARDEMLVEGLRHKGYTVLPPDEADPSAPL